MLIIVQHVTNEERVCHQLVYPDLLGSILARGRSHQRIGVRKVYTRRRLPHVLARPSTPLVHQCQAAAAAAVAAHRHNEQQH